MANVSSYGVLTAADALPGYLSQKDAQVIWDTTNENLSEFSADVQRSFAPFVELTTTDYKRLYFSADGGEMQEVDVTNDMGRTGEVKGGSSWDVSFPIRGFRDELGGSERAIAQLSKQEFDNRIQTVKNRYLAIYRRQTIKALFTNTSYNFKDTKYGNLTIYPLANGDAVTYASADGLTAPATRNNYIGVAADWTTLSDVKNPIPTIVARLRLLFGRETAQNPIVVFINSAQEASAGTLADFHEVGEIYINPGGLAETVTGYPTNLPGRVIGKCDGALIIVWDQVPAGYMVGLHLGAKPPLIRRIDPPQLNTSPDLVLTNPMGDPNYPFIHWRFQTYFGLAVGNRPNGVVCDLTAAGGASTYTIPAGVA